MESRCHLGKKRLYDTITKYGWSQDVRTHRIGVIIDKLLAEDWDPDAGIEVPEEEDEEEDCDVCLFFFFLDCIPVLGSLTS